MDLNAPLVDLRTIAHGARVNSAAQATQALTAQALGTKGNTQELRRAAEEFEAVFLAQMLAPMFEIAKTDGLFGGGPGEDVYRSMMVEEYGKAIARSGGVGIADHVERELLRIQEASTQ